MRDSCWTVMVHIQELEYENVKLNMELNFEYG
jgi:hypothetical protein